MNRPRLVLLLVFALESASGGAAPPDAVLRGVTTSRGGLVPLTGVVQSPSGLSIKGSWRTGQTSAQLDEVSLVDPSTGNKPVTLPADAITAVDVLGTPFASSLGRFSAGVTVFHTRSGSDRWRTIFNGLVPGFRMDRQNQLKMTGIDGFAPRLTVTGPIAAGRVFLAQSVQYFFASHDVRSRTGRSELIVEPRWNGAGTLALCRGDSRPRRVPLTSSSGS